MDYPLSALAWILGPILLGAALIYAIMRRRRSRTVTLPPDHPAPEHTTQVSTNAQDDPRQR